MMSISKIFTLELNYQEEVELFLSSRTSQKVTYRDSDDNNNKISLWVTETTNLFSITTPF